jgi:hypothetical protein
MDLDDLHVRISSSGFGERYELLVRLFPAEGEPFQYRQPIMRGSRAGSDRTAVSPRALNEIREVIAKCVVGSWATGRIPNKLWPGRLLLEVEPLELVKVDWEGSLPGPPLPRSLVLTRFRAVSDERVLQSFELPIRLLLVQHITELLVKPSDRVMRYFRGHQVTGILDEELSHTIRSGKYEIVHLVADARRRPSSDRLFFEPNINLRRALSSCRARFLILQCASQTSFVPALQFAHQLLESGGPTTLVVEGATARYLDDLYMGVVHNTPLDRINGVRRRARTRAAIFLGIGGDRVLQIRPLAERLSRRVQHSISASRSLLKRLEPAQEAPTEFGGPSIVAMHMKNMRAHVATARRIYDYSRESGAWIPLTRDARAHSHQAQQIEQLQRAIDRVVNVGLFYGGRNVPADEPLKPGQIYELSLQIGRRTTWSLVDGDAAFPDEVLARELSSVGVILRVVVFGPSFGIPSNDQVLHLGPPPTESDELRFPLRTPRSSGRYRIRICIYHEMNLLQSIMVRVTVSENAVNRQQRTIEAEVEFALSSTLADIERLPKRQFNFLQNASDDGSHTMAVVGTSFRTSFDFGETEMRTAVDAARSALYSIAADTSSRQPKYRFDATNSTSVAQLEQDAIRLAELGYQLYSNIVTGKSRAFAKELRDALGPSGASIQVASTKSARYVFPWSLVYDHPLVVGTLKLCPQFAADAAAQNLASQICLAKGCPNRGKTNIVCPSGFWGFKHIIEQPLSVSVEPDASEKSDLVLDIDGGKAGGEVSGLMVVSRELNQVGVHVTELGIPRSFKFQVKDNKVEAGECLQDPQRAAHLVYFYCHGGRDKTKTWLGVGVKERLQASDLTGLDIDWTGTHPLIFINGCHTADFTPDDLLNFNQVFAWCRAAGVIGTEISVPEGLAREFARGFLLRFAGGTSVGDALHEQRLDLLGRRNLLGLAYTPYCSAALKMVYH